MRNNTTKQRIFDTALQLFAEKGFHAVSVRELSAAAYLNEASLYYYYKNKEHILDEILLEYDRKLASYSIGKQQAQEWAQTLTAEETLQKYAAPIKPEDACFMDHAFRIVCMEQFTNAKARQLISKELYGKTQSSVYLALCKLQEREKLAPLDARALATAWADCRLAALLLQANARLDHDDPLPPAPDSSLNLLIDYARPRP